MIHKYQQWLEESEKMEAEAAAPVSTDTPDATDNTAVGTPTDVPAEPADAPAETADAPIEEIPAESEIEQFRDLDTKRKDAIKAFKAKQEEFLQIPDDIRKNPVEEEDKTKVEELKTELISLNTQMKDAIKAWDSFNDKMLGLEDETAPDYEP